MTDRKLKTKFKSAVGCLSEIKFELTDRRFHVGTESAAAATTRTHHRMDEKWWDFSQISNPQDLPLCHTEQSPRTASIKENQGYAFRYKRIQRGMHTCPQSSTLPPRLSFCDMHDFKCTEKQGQGETLCTHRPPLLKPLLHQSHLQGPLGNVPPSLKSSLL